jgi:hypothetical protein
MNSLEKFKSYVLSTSQQKNVLGGKLATYYCQMGSSSGSWNRYTYDAATSSWYSIIGSVVDSGTLVNCNTDGPCIS